MYCFFKIELTSNKVFFHRALQVGKERVSSYIGMHMRFLSGDKCLDNHEKYEYLYYGTMHLKRD